MVAVAAVFGGGVMQNVFMAIKLIGMDAWLEKNNGRQVGGGGLYIEKNRLGQSED